MQPGPWRFAGLGVQLLVAILIGVFAGRWLDHKVGTEGVFTIIGGLLGFGATMYSLLRELSKMNKEGP